MKRQCLIVICGTNLIAISRWIVYEDIKLITIIPGRDGRLELSLIPYHNYSIKIIFQYVSFNSQQMGSKKLQIFMFFIIYMKDAV